MWRDPALVLDILLAAEDATAFTSSLDRTAFEASKLHQHAVIRCLEIMAEAANRTSPEFRTTHSVIPWRLMTDMRNRLIHGYAEVDLDTVWDVVRNRLPPLIQTLRAIVPPDQPPSDPPKGTDTP
jgi:uncharacterized protein with HEPN domain